jgi:HNH endonuclease
MAICIFCLKDKPPSEEHFIPAALGGHIVLRDCVCQDDNNSFAAQFETELFRELVPLRLLLQIPDRDGKIPTSNVVVKIDGKDYKGRIKDGTVQMAPIIQKHVMPDGVLELSAKFLTDAMKADWDKRVADGKWIPVAGVSEKQGPEEGEVHLGGELEVCSSSQGLRNAAKISFLGLVRQIGPKMVLVEGFNPIRRFIMSGEGNGLVRLFVLEPFLDMVQLGPHQHSLILAARNSERRIDAIVRIFGGMCYFVNLSSAYAGADFFLTFAYDACRGEENGALQTQFFAEFLQVGDILTNPETVWDDRALWGQRFIIYLEAELQAFVARRRANAEPTS